MKDFDNMRAKIEDNYKGFMRRMPFEGDFPDLTRPENFNRFKRELKEYVFSTKEKDGIKKEIDMRVAGESKGKKKKIISFLRF